MRLRKIISRNRRAVVVAALVLMTASIALFIYRITPQKPPAPLELVTMAYFYDRNTRELFPMPDTTDGPIEAASGQYHGQPAGIRAHLFSCGSCFKKADRFIGWLEIPAQHVTSSRPPDEPGNEEIEKGDDVERMMIRAPDNDQWVPLSSTRGDTIMKAVNRCAEGEIRYCRPRPQPWRQQEEIERPG